MPHCILYASIDDIYAIYLYVLTASVAFIARSMIKYSVKTALSVASSTNENLLLKVTNIEWTPLAVIYGNIYYKHV